MAYGPKGRLLSTCLAVAFALCLRNQRFGAVQLAQGGPQCRTEGDVLEDAEQAER